MEEFELLKHIYKDSEMAVFTLEELLDDLKEKDNKIKKRVEDILHKYEYFKEESSERLEEEGQSLPKTNAMSKMGAGMGIKKEVKHDNSDSSIADMLIKGISMGSIEMEKKIKDYKGEVEKGCLSFAKEFLAFQEEATKHLKEYL